MKVHSSRQFEYTFNRRLGFIYRNRRGAAVARIVPQDDRGADDEFEAAKLFIEKAIIAAQKDKPTNE